MYKGMGYDIFRVQLKNQSGAWYAEAVDRAAIRKLEKN